MHPDRRRKSDLDHGGETDNNEAEKEDDKDSRAVPGILRRKVKTADFAGRANVQETGVQSSVAAARAPAAERGTRKGDHRKLAHPATPAPPLPSPHQ